MQLCTLIDFESLSWYISNPKEKCGIKVAHCMEKAHIKAKYRNATKKEYQLLEPYIAEKDRIAAQTGKSFVYEREKLFNLATIYYKQDASTGMLPVVIDIHYHLNRSKNGYRNEADVRKNVNDMLLSFGYQKDLVMGGYTCEKKHTGRNTSHARKHIKQYKKVE